MAKYNYKKWRGPYVDAAGWHPASFTRHSVPVKILSQTEKTYKISLCGFHEDGRGPGTILNVKKSNVTL